MLDYLLPIEWCKGGDSAWLGKPIGALPEGLELLARPTSNPIAPRYRRDDAVRLHLPWVFRKQGMIALDAPVDFNFDAYTFKIESRALQNVWTRIRAAREHEGIRLGDRSAGCFGQVGVSPVSAIFLDAVGPSFAALLRDRGNTVWLGEGNGTDLGSALPDGLAFRSDALPREITLTLEATTACNFQCGFCYGRHLKQGVLHAHQFSAVLDNMRGVVAVEFTGEGEPLMNRDTPRMIRLCKERGLWVHLTSNGSRMTLDRARMIVDLGIDSFAVSIESTDPDEYARFRPGGVLAELEHAIDLMRRVKTEKGKGPELRLFVSLVRSKLSEVEGFMSYGDRLGFDHVEFQTLNGLPAYGRFYPLALNGEISDRADLIDALAQPGLTDRARQVLLDLCAEFEGAICDRFMRGLAPNWQGLVSPCCLLKVPDFPSLGDLTTMTLEELWLGTEFRRFRFAAQHGVVLRSCDGCATMAGARGLDMTEYEDLVE